MEKLQAALASARQKRVEKLPASRQQESFRRKSRMLNFEPMQIWGQLAPFTPMRNDLEQKRVVTQQASSAATPFDILRTKILLQMRQNGWTRLAITSAMPNSGKSTIACNLALGFGRQKELKSMLFDLDLRDPSINDFFQTEPKQSISSMLEGHVEFKDQAIRVGDNLAVSMANYAESDPTRILLAEQTEEVLDEIQKVYMPDLMIFDLPSVLVNDDARAFLKNVDCALIIARANQTKYSQLDICEREVAEHTNVLGVVLNAYHIGKHGVE